MHHWVNICSNYQFHNYSIRLCGVQMIAYDRKCMYISFFRKNAGNEFSIKWFSRYKYVKRHVLYGAHRFSHRCKIEQRSKSCGYFDMIFTVATALADILLIFIPFHFIAEANTGKWQKIKNPHMNIELNMCLQISISVSVSVFFVCSDLAQMHSKLVTINPIGFRTRTHTSRYKDAHTMHSRRTMVR